MPVPSLGPGAAQLRRDIEVGPGAAVAGRERHAQADQLRQTVAIVPIALPLGGSAGLPAAEIGEVDSIDAVQQYGFAVVVDGWTRRTIGAEDLPSQDQL